VSVSIHTTGGLPACAWQEELLAAIIFKFVEFITSQFGVWVDVGPLLQQLLFG
jgi:hypothetical protein